MASRAFWAYARMIAEPSERLTRMLDEACMPKKMAKQTVKKAHKIARRVAASGSASNPWAVGTAVAKKNAAKRKRARGK